MDASFESSSSARSRRLDGVTRAGDLARWAAVPIVVTSLAPHAMGFLAVSRRTLFLSGTVETLVWLAGVVLFLRWLHRAVANTSLLLSPVAWRPAQAVGSFFLPFVGLYRPYRIVADVYRASDPSGLPDAPSFVSKEPAGYRESALERLPATRWSYPAPIGAWWSVYILRSFVGVALIQVVGVPTATVLMVTADLVACALCLLVMRSINGRQRELCRRLDAVARGSRAAGAVAAS